MSVSKREPLNYHVIVQAFDTLREISNLPEAELKKNESRLEILLDQLKVIHETYPESREKTVAIFYFMKCYEQYERILPDDITTEQQYYAHKDFYENLITKLNEEFFRYFEKNEYDLQGYAAEVAYNLAYHYQQKGHACEKKGELETSLEYFSKSQDLLKKAIGWGEESIPDYGGQLTKFKSKCQNLSDRINTMASKVSLELKKAQVAPYSQSHAEDVKEREERAKREREEKFAKERSGPFAGAFFQSHDDLPRGAGTQKQTYESKQTNKKEFYEILGVKEDASQREIKLAYKALALIQHPDKAPPGKTEEYTNKFKKINEAYETLKDPEKRAAYDRSGPSARFG